MLIWPHASCRFGMSKVGEPSVTLDWLRRRPAPSSEGKFSDLVAFRKLLSPSELDMGLFENTYGLKPVPTAPVPVEKIESRLNLSDLDGRPIRSTFQEQVSSLLPGPEVISDYDRLHQSLTYLLSRVIIDRFPKKTDWALDAKGLDPLTAALFFLNDLARFAGQSIDWVKEIHRPMSEWAPVFQEQPLNLRPDGPLAWEWRELLGRVRGRLNVLLCPELREISVLTLTTQGVVQVTRAMLQKELGLSYRRARHAVEYLRMVFSERFFPAISRLGLQYRYHFSPKQRYTLWSRGIMERMTVSGPSTSSVCAHLEPAESEGPPRTESRPARGLFQVVVDQEQVSFQLNRFKPETGWTVGTWPPPREWQDPRDIPDWLTHYSVGEPSSFQLTENDLGLLGVLWAHRGSQYSRHRLLGLIGVRRDKRSSSISRILSQGIGTVMYHPTLDLCGLPEGFVLGIRRSSKSSDSEVSEVKRWLLWALPYARVLTDSSSQNLVVYGRLPLYRSGIYTEMLEQVLRERFRVEYRVGRLETSSTYITTVLSRLYDSETESWSDAW